jgi:hypothetical protein
MPIVRDFRTALFRLERIDRCGRHIGSRLYWKLYTVENVLRIVIHSVLTVQIGSQWWNLAVDPKVRAKAIRFRADYAAKPRNANPGASDIHLLFLTDLAEILRTNSNQFAPIVKDVDQWVANLESIRVPRNLVGHMNFPNAFDKAAIESAYLKLQTLVDQLQQAKVPIVMPR